MPAYARGYWPALMRVDPSRAKLELEQAVVKQPTMKAAAADLGVSRETLYKYLRALKLPGTRARQAEART